jgi:hypothetical protein
LSNLAIVEEISKPNGNAVQMQSARLPFVRRFTPDRIEQLAKTAARGVVEGFIAQDRHDFDAASLHFSVMFQTMFPEYDSERLLKASESFVSALLTQSKLKDEHFDLYNRLHDERWGFVRSQLSNTCRLLDIPDSFGLETEEVWRYHAGRDDTYVKHIIEFHRVLVRRLTGSEAGFKELAGLYTTGLAFHDQHSVYGVKRGIEVMELYFRILFDAMGGTTREMIPATSG